MKHIFSFLWSHCLNKKVILDSLGKSRGGWESALGQWACYDNEYPAITTTTTPTTTSLRWGRHGTFAFGRCRFGHLHMTANWGKGAAQAAVTVACGSYNISGHSTVLQVQLEDLQRPPRYHNLFGHHVSQEGLQVSLMCSARLSTATITNCPKPRREVALLDQLFLSSHVPLFECCMNFLSHAIAANKRRLVNGGRRSADQRYEIAKWETCQYYRGQWSLALIRLGSPPPFT